jgi:hypothetical protein
MESAATEVLRPFAIVDLGLPNEIIRCHYYCQAQLRLGRKGGQEIYWCPRCNLERDVIVETPIEIVERSALQLVA